MPDLSFAALKTIKAFIIEPSVTWCGYALQERGIEKHAAYSVLRIFEREGWVRSVINNTTSKRRKSLYEITDKGLNEGQAALRELQLPSSLRS